MTTISEIEEKGKGLGLTFKPYGDTETSTYLYKNKVYDITTSPSGKKRIIKIRSKKAILKKGTKSKVWIEEKVLAERMKEH